MSQQTLILLKPDAVQRRLVGDILTRFERKGLRLAGLKLVQASRDLAEKHYAVHKGKPFYESLLSFLTSGPTVAMVFEGREAVAVGRNLMGQFLDVGQYLLQKLPRSAWSKEANQVVTTMATALSKLMVK